MYLNRLEVKKFRSINELTLEFKKGLNVIIGENGTGKSAIIDALRICLGYGKQWRDIGIKNDEDFFIDVTNVNYELEPIEFHCFFEIELEEDRRYFQSLIHQFPDDPERQEIQIHFRYYLERTETGNLNLRYRNWGGSIEGQQIDPNEAQLIYFTYLAALRNAEVELRPYYRENKISSLYRELTTYSKAKDDGTEESISLTEELKAQLAYKLQSVIEDEDWSGLIKTGEDFINNHLENADISNNSSKVHVKILEYKYDNVVKGVLARKPVFDQSLVSDDPNKQLYFDVSQNGLGENNLIYASAVLGDLENRRREKKEHYYALLIEEPEAHLHPQRQRTFFNYLNSLGDLDVQIFMTSHSPTLTAKIDLDNLILLRRSANETSAFNLVNSTLDNIEKAHLRRFLDVTKSQMFFAKGVILVEGVSEALLMPSFAKKLNKDLDKNGVEIVNINGVAFKPFAKLFNNTSSSKRLSSKCSIISDGDEHRFGGNISSRASNLNDLKPDEPCNLDVFLALNTFEYELMIQSKYNADLMRQLYLEIHPQTDLLEGDDLAGRALQLLDKLDQNKDKAVFAQNLSFHFQVHPDALENFDIPAYLNSAISWVTN